MLVRRVRRFARIERGDVTLQPVERGSARVEALPPRAGLRRLGLEAGPTENRRVHHRLGGRLGPRHNRSRGDKDSSGYNKISSGKHEGISVAKRRQVKRGDVCPLHLGASWHPHQTGGWKPPSLARWEACRYPVAAGILACQSAGLSAA